MKSHRLSACLLGFAFTSVSTLALAGPPEVPPPPQSEPPSAPPPESPATSEPAPAAAAAAPTAPPEAIADRPPLESSGRKIDLSTPPPAESNPRTYHMHDGFYLRASVGFGSLHAAFSDDRVSNDTLDGAGGSLHLNLLIGGSPSPGLALGGALLAEGTASVDFDYNGHHAYNRSTSLVVLAARSAWRSSPSGKIASTIVDRRTESAARSGSATTSGSRQIGR